MLTGVLCPSGVCAAEATHEYVFVIDTSASMQQNKLVGPLRVALDDFADTIPKDGTSRVWIMTFDSGLSDDYLIRQIAGTKDLEETKVFLSEIEYPGKATYIYRALDQVLAYAEGTVQDGKPHNFIIHLFTDGSNNDPAPYTFESNVERFNKLRKAPACAVEFYYHALQTAIPENVAKLIEATEGMHAISGLGMPPIARFVLPDVAITDITPVTFVNATIGQADRFDWDFGDGATSTDPSPTHTFKPGQYEVKLVASSRAGKSQAITPIIVRGEPPQADFTLEEPLKPKYVGAAVQFTDHSRGQITSRTWKFGDGAESQEVNPKHVYRAADQFVVTLEVDGPFGKKDEPSVATRIFKVELPPDIRFVFFPKAPVQDKEVEFINQSRGDFHGWQWKFGDGTTSQDANPKHTYGKAGTYEVELSAQDAAGVSLTKTQKLSVGTDWVKPEARFTLPVPSVGIGQELTLVDQSEGTVDSRSWDMGDGTKIDGATVTHAYRNSGTFAITLSVSGAPERTPRRQNWSSNRPS